jgi:tetratricopeptide (TPR) repeat protein
MQTLAQEFGFTKDQAHAVISKGFDLFESGDLDGAAIIFEGMLALNPLDAGLFGALGSLRKMQGKNDEAFAAFNESISLDSKAPVARFHRGELYLAQGKIKEAQVDLKVASEVDSPLKSKALAALKIAK